MAVERAQLLDQDGVEQVRVVLLVVAGEAQEREGGAVGDREVADQVVAPVEQPSKTSREPAISAELERAGRVAFSARSSSAFGARFQTPLNQSRKISASARRAGSRG